jgi:hypothetical protein
LERTDRRGRLTMIIARLDRADVPPLLYKIANGLGAQAVA